MTRRLLNRCAPSLVPALVFLRAAAPPGRAAVTLVEKDNTRLDIELRFAA
jgi:hypothetical protein